MSTSPPPEQRAAPTAPATAPAHAAYDVFGAVLSYLIPGLGQVYQGRVGKGLMFMVCLLGMFVYGMHLGEWKNVYLPDLTRNQGAWNFPPRVVANAFNRLPFAGQFWIGVAAWPALLQYHGIELAKPETSKFWHEFQRAPENEIELNRLQAESPKGKLWDLGWVYTVVAGVLNILVIYDALAGPALLANQEENEPAGTPQEAAA